MSGSKKMPEIEELSELSWRRVERRVFDVLDAEMMAPTRVDLTRPSHGWSHAQRFALAGGFVALAAAAAVIAWPKPSAPVQPVAQAPHTSRFVTTDAPSQVSVGDAALTVGPDSAVTVGGAAESGVLLVLERGSVQCAVAPRRERPPFVVQAGEARIEVVGTKFTVARWGESARVTVEEGLVKVSARGEFAEVPAGSTWPAEAKPVSIAAAEPAPPARADASRRGRAREEKAAVPVAVPMPAVLPPPTSKERFEVAARLEARDPAAAVTLYAELSALNDEWAAPALYAQARLEVDRGQDAVAAKLLRSYLKRYPTGQNAQDARQLLLRFDAHR